MVFFGLRSVSGLSRLHRNIRALDNLLDDRDPSSVRVAWRELRDNVEREAEARSAFVNTIRSDVLPPLKALREEQERTRKRIYEDLKDGTSAHTDFLESTLPRLKKNYLKKYQEVEVSLVVTFLSLNPPCPLFYSFFYCHWKQVLIISFISTTLLTRYCYPVPCPCGGTCTNAIGPQSCRTATCCRWGRSRFQYQCPVLWAAYYRNSSGIT